MDTPPNPVARYVWTMRGLAALYGVMAMVFFFFPAELVYLVNVGPKVFKLTEALPDIADRFWTVMSATAAVTLCALALFAAESPRIRGYALIQILAKVFTAAGFLTMYLQHARLFAYLVGLVSEALLALLTLWVMIGAGKASKEL